MEKDEGSRQQENVCKSLQRSCAQPTTQKLISAAEPRAGPDEAGEVGRGSIILVLWVEVRSLDSTLKVESHIKSFKPRECCDLKVCV